MTEILLAIYAVGFLSSFAGLCWVCLPDWRIMLPFGLAFTIRHAWADATAALLMAVAWPIVLPWMLWRLSSD